MPGISKMAPRSSNRDGRRNQPRKPGSRPSSSKLTKEEIMSLISGDKSRAGRRRKSQIAKRARNRVLRQSLLTKPHHHTVPAPAAAPVAEKAKKPAKKEKPS